MASELENELRTLIMLEKALVTISKFFDHMKPSKPEKSTGKLKASQVVFP